jgi:photosystem II stability/assembly factor-like uncharacterized protein
MNLKLLASGVAAFALGVATAVLAQDPGFVLQGEGGLVTTLVLDPSSSNTLYAATSRGLFKSADAGATWRRTGAGLQNHSLLALAVDPLAPSKLYATTDTGGVFRSTDAGEHWTDANEGIGARYVGAITVDPHRSGSVYAGAEAGRVFHSTDGGATWKELASPTSRVGVTVVAVDPITPGLVYVGTNSEGIFWTADGGVKWSHPSERLSHGTVWNLMFDRAPGSLMVGTHDGLFRSANAGASWTPSNRGLRSWNVLSLASDPSAPATLYAGTAAAIYKSADAGQSWTELQADLYVSALAIDPRAPSTLYAATQMGVIKSTDGGANWTALHLAGAPAEAPVAASLPKLPIRSTALPARGTDRLPPSGAVPPARTAAKPPLPPLPIKPSRTG